MSNIQLYNEENTADLALKEQVLTEIREYDSFNCNMRNWVSLDIPSLRRKINFLSASCLRSLLPLRLSQLRWYLL